MTTTSLGLWENLITIVTSTYNHFLYICPHSTSPYVSHLWASEVSLSLLSKGVHTPLSQHQVSTAYPCPTCSLSTMFPTHFFTDLYWTSLRTSKAINWWFPPCHYQWHLCRWSLQSHPQIGFQRYFDHLACLQSTWKPGGSQSHAHWHVIQACQWNSRTNHSPETFAINWGERSCC